MVDLEDEDLDEEDRVVDVLVDEIVLDDEIEILDHMYHLFLRMEEILGERDILRSKVEDHLGETVEEVVLVVEIEVDQDFDLHLEGKEDLLATEGIVLHFLLVIEVEKEDHLGETVEEVVLVVEIVDQDQKEDHSVIVGQDQRDLLRSHY